LSLVLGNEGHGPRASLGWVEAADTTLLPISYLGVSGSAPKASVADADPLDNAEARCFWRKPLSICWGRGEIVFAADDRRGLPVATFFNCKLRRQSK